MEVNDTPDSLEQEATNITKAMALFTPVLWFMYSIQGLSLQTSAVAAVATATLFTVVAIVGTAYVVYDVTHRDVLTANATYQ